MPLVENRPRAYFYWALTVPPAILIIQWLWIPHLLDEVPLLLLGSSSIIIAWFGGLSPGVITTLWSALLAAFFVLPPRWSFMIENPADHLRIALFVAVGIVTSIVSQELHRAKRKAEETAGELAKERLRAVEAAERLRVTLASIGDAVIATDSDGVVRFLNPAAEALTGWKQEEASGQSLESVFHIVNERTRLPVENPALRAMREGRTVGLANHTVLITRDGREIPIDDAGSPIRDAEEKTLGAVLIFRDIIGRRQAERMQAEAREAAEAAELRLKLALDAGHMGTWEYGITTGKVVWSTGLEQIHGYPPGAFPGTFEAFRDEIHPDDREHVLHAIGEAIGQRQDHHIEYRIVRKDGSVRWVEGQGRLFLDADGKPDRMVGVCADVTERKNAEEAENKARRAAEEANRAKDEFLAMVSHELRNPLSAILGWAAILNRGDTPVERVKQAYEVIERNARAEARLVESLLDSSRIVAGQLRLDSERVDLPGLLETVIDSVRPAADSKAIKLEIVSAGEIMLIGDSGRLHQVFSNLLTNAVKFTPRGGLIQIRVTRSGSQAQIQVIDNGEGIDPDFLPHIFDRFRQAESTAGRKHGGLGLGLAIVRELVHAHGGRVTAESPGKGHGSTFTVALPIPAVIPAHIEAAKPPILHTEVVSLLGLRVLVVDDDADARESVGMTLESRGAVIQLASSASEALRLISRNRPDVMIADIGMPQEDGYVLIRTLRALEREHSHSRLPAVALTAYASAADRDRILAAGYDVHLPKPVGPADLMQAVVTFRRASQHRA